MSGTYLALYKPEQREKTVFGEKGNREHGYRYDDIYLWLVGFCADCIGLFQAIQDHKKGYGKVDVSIVNHAPGSTLLEIRKNN